jgi:hypothetical protein
MAKMIITLGNTHGSEDGILWAQKSGVNCRRKVGSAPRDGAPGQKDVQQNAAVNDQRTLETLESLAVQWRVRSEASSKRRIKLLLLLLRKRDRNRQSEKIPARLSRTGQCVAKDRQGLHASSPSCSSDPYTPWQLGRNTCSHTNGVPALRIRGLSCSSFLSLLLPLDFFFGRRVKRISRLGAQASNSGSSSG